MNKLFKRPVFWRQHPFILGGGISMFGSIAPGTINLLMVQIALDKGALYAIGVSAGSAFIEIIFVWYTLTGVAAAYENKRIFRKIEWLATAFILFLSSYLLYHTFVVKSYTHSETSFQWYAFPSLLAGCFLRFFLPVCIPYWIGWNTVLLSNRMLENSSFFSKMRYVAGIGLGTTLAHSFYIVSAISGILFFSDQSLYLKRSIAIILLLIGLSHTRRLLRRKDSSENLYINL